MRCSALLLAGGKSSRMGRDKALLEIAGEPLWHRQLTTLRQLSPEQLMFAGPLPEGCDCEQVTDESTSAGPLAGVAAALRRCVGPHLVVLALDLPGMTITFLRELLGQCGPEHGIVPRTRERFEPLAAVYPPGVASLALDCLQRGELSMQNFARRALAAGWLRERELAPNELELFTNLNTPADYEKFRDRKVHQSR